MTATEAKSYIELYGATETPPLVTPAEVDRLIAAHIDTSTGEIAADDVTVCVADVWMIKTGRVTDHHDVSVNGRTMQASQVKKHCEEQEKTWRRRLSVKVA